MTPRVSIIVPEFGDRAVASHVVALYAQTVPRGWQCISGARDLREEVVSSIAACRNALARESTGDTLIFNDADSICPGPQVLEAVRLAEEAPGLVFAFTNYCRLSQKTTESLTSWRDAFDAPVEWEMYGSNSSGCVAISRRCFEQVGGYDETWLDGYEDYDFAFRCAEMFGPNRRVEGDLIHLWHPRPAVEPENGRDRERFEKKWLVSR